MRVVWIVAILLAALPAAAAVEVRSQRFRVVGEADSATLVQAASHLEATAERLAVLGFHLRHPELPVTVLIFASQDQLSRFRTRSQARAFVATAEDGHFIAIAWNAPGNPWLALAHEYAHLTSDSGAPAWFREGLADYLSYEQGAGTARISPTSTIIGLRSKPWLGIADMLSAQNDSAAYSHELFYAQSWLAVSWLASQPGALPRTLAPQQIEDQFALGGAPALEVQLRGHVAQMPIDESELPALPPPLAGLAPRELPDDEWQAWQLELLRGMKGNSDAEADLLAFESRGAQSPLVQAALGTLAMERGRFDEAEDRLRASSADSEASALTHHRYALLLLRPTREAPGPRAEEALVHARRALEMAPGKPEFLRTLAQANVVVGYWSRAAQILLELQSKQGWDVVASEDFQELLRRRGQHMRAVDAPRIGAPAPLSAGASSTGPTAPPPLPEFVKARPAPLRQPHDWPWPPPDTLIYAGRIGGVDCSSGQKRIIMHSALFRIEFVESLKQPAKLHRPPLRWKTLPCGTYGWNVHIAYIPYRGKGRITGEARAILF